MKVVLTLFILSFWSCLVAAFFALNVSIILTFLCLLCAYGTAGGALDCWKEIKNGVR